MKTERNHIHVGKSVKFILPITFRAEEIPFPKMFFRMNPKPSVAVHWQLKQKLKLNELPFYILCTHQKLSLHLSVFSSSAEILLFSFL